MNAPLTARQSQVLAFIQSFTLENGIAPSSREIQHHFGFASQTAAMGHLKALRAKGAIANHDGKARASVLASDPLREGIRAILSGKGRMEVKLKAIAELVG